MAAQGTRWTNKSVRGLGGDTDPINVVVAKARQVTLDAMADGWSGPPFDPAELAVRLGLIVEPREDIRDARTVPAPGGRLKIEFNPNRPRGRVRYSIAHEIVHTFFPDCAAQVRNRADKSEMDGDEWQLEMLCNIGAAELVMPVGSFPDLRDRELSIDDLMAVRQEYDVSIEALLLRFIRLTNTSCALFAASRVETGANEGRYRIDYAVASTTWNGTVPLGQHLNDHTLLAECTAIGFTAKGEETWPNGGRFRVECVGTPPYPGRLYPRVLGLLMDCDEAPAKRNMLKIVAGNALSPRGGGPQIIAHVVNDRSLTWGGGFAKQVAIHYSEAQLDFRQWCHVPGHHKLGKTHFYGDPKHVEIASMVAQQGFGASETPRIRYPALETCLAAVRARARAHGASVHIPRIGCGQAGGKWEVVQELIESEMVDHDVAVTVYDLPPRARSPR